MTREVEACRPEASLAAAAAVMWRRDCGAVPVTGEDGGVIGMLTDRDICMALATRRAYAEDVSVAEVMSRDVATCTTEDDAEEALEVMRLRRLRRLPAVDSRGRLAGILSVADVLRRTRKGGGRRHFKPRETLAALKAIVRPHGDVDEEHEPSAVGDEGDSPPAVDTAGGESAAVDDSRPAVHEP